MSVIALLKKGNKSSGMAAIGNMNDYMRYKAAQAVGDAAKNEGGGAGQGMGLGMGAGMGMMLPGMLSGYMQEWLGYPGFFVWVVMATIPGFLMAYLAKYPRDFGKRAEN